MTDRTKAMDALTAGDADLYDVPAAEAVEQVSELIYAVVGHDYSATTCDQLAERVVSAIASARIKGDKDRLASRAPPLEYDHTQDGTANFERALLYASYHEVGAERLTKALERANAQTEQFERDYYLKCDEHERDMKDAAVFMGKRDGQIQLLTELAHQYLSDLRYPPSADSKERRIEWIKAVIAKVTDRPEVEL